MELHAFEEMAQALETSMMPGTMQPAENTKPTSVFPAVTPPGMAYVPFQQWGEVYSSEKGFQNGTMFPVLDLPFAPDSVGGGCTK